MKRGGPLHPKVALLAAALGIERYAAVGLLECLWHFAAQYALGGDVGRYPDGHIASAVGWPVAEAERLITTLTNCRFLDADLAHRVIVHDWHEHADETVRRQLSRRGQWFVTSRKKVKKTSDTNTRPCRTSPPGDVVRLGVVSSVLSEERESERKPRSEFATWYAAYPRKKKPADAEKAWHATVRDRPPLATMLAALAAQCRSPEWLKDGGQYVPYPATYLRAHSWADDLGPVTVSERPVENLAAIKVNPIAARMNALAEERKRG